MPKPIREYVNKFYPRVQGYNARQLAVFKQYFDAKARSGSEKSKQAAAQMSRFFEKLSQSRMFQEGFANLLSNPNSDAMVEQTLADLGQIMDKDTNGSDADVIDSFHTFLNEGGYDELKDADSPISKMYPLLNALTDIHQSLVPTARGSVMVDQFEELYQKDLGDRIDLEKKGVQIISTVGRTPYANTTVSKIAEEAAKAEQEARKEEEEYNRLKADGGKSYRTEYESLQRQIDEETKKLNELNRGYTQTRKMVEDRQKELDEIQKLEDEFTAVVRLKKQTEDQFKEVQKELDQIDQEFTVFNNTYRDLDNYMKYNHIGEEFKENPLNPKSKRQAEKEYFDLCVEEIKWRKLDEKIQQIDALAADDKGSTIPLYLMDPAREKSKLFQLLPQWQKENNRKAWALYDEIREVIPDELKKFEKNKKNKKNKDKTNQQLYEEVKAFLKEKHEQTKANLQKSKIGSAVLNVNELKKNIEDTAEALSKAEEKDKPSLTKMLDEYRELHLEKMNELAKLDPQALTTYEKAGQHQERTAKREALERKKKPILEKYEKCKQEGLKLSEEYDRIVTRAMKITDAEELNQAKHAFHRREMRERSYALVVEAHEQSFKLQTLLDHKDKVKKEIDILKKDVMAKPKKDYERQKGIVDDLKARQRQYLPKKYLKEVADAGARVMLLRPKADKFRKLHQRTQAAYQKRKEFENSRARLMQLKGKDPMAGHKAGISKRMDTFLSQYDKAQSWFNWWDSAEYKDIKTKMETLKADQIRDLTQGQINQRLTDLEKACETYRKTKEEQLVSGKLFTTRQREFRLDFADQIKNYCRTMKEMTTGARVDFTEEQKQTLNLPGIRNAEPLTEETFCAYLENHLSPDAKDAVQEYSSLLKEVNEKLQKEDQYRRDKNFDDRIYKSALRTLQLRKIRSALQEAEPKMKKEENRGFTDNIRRQIDHIDQDVELYLKNPISDELKTAYENHYVNGINTDNVQIIFNRVVQEKQLQKELKLDWGDMVPQIPLPEPKEEIRDPKAKKTEKDTKPKEPMKKGK